LLREHRLIVILQYRDLDDEWLLTTVPLLLSQDLGEKYGYPWGEIGVNEQLAQVIRTSRKASNFILRVGGAIYSDSIDLDRDTRGAPWRPRLPHTLQMSALTASNKHGMLLDHHHLAYANGWPSPLQEVDEARASRPGGASVGP
jgi:hypothetical protein